MDTFKQFTTAGFVVLEQLPSPIELQQIENVLATTPLSNAGSRELLNETWCQTLANQLKTNQRLVSLLPNPTIAIQCTLFKKLIEKNWLVPLHQDLSISLKKKLDKQGYTGWSAKQQMLFVQPPAEILEQLVAVRLHIDDCFAEHGPLKVVTGTHQQGRIPEKDWPTIRNQLGEQTCLTAKGGAVVMRPLILHSSSKAEQANGSRVLHFLFAPAALANELPLQFSI